MMTYEEAQLVTENRDLGWLPGTVEEADAVKEAHLRAVAWANPPQEPDMAGDNEDDGFWLNAIVCCVLAFWLLATVWWAVRIIGSVW